MTKTIKYVVILDPNVGDPHEFDSVDAVCSFVKAFPRFTGDMGWVLVRAIHIHTVKTVVEQLRPFEFLTLFDPYNSRSATLTKLGSQNFLPNDEDN